MALQQLYTSKRGYEYANISLQWLKVVYMQYLNIKYKWYNFILLIESDFFKLVFKS